MPINWLQVGTGAGLMTFGVALYAIVRSSTLWGFLPDLHLPGLEEWLGRAGGSAPTFFHVAAMSLLTAGVLGGTTRLAWGAALTWISTDIVFELGQHELLRVYLIGSVPEWLERVWLVDRTRSYFLNGTFDAMDIVAAVLGGFTALALMLQKPSTGESP
jgi:hypothetical protein